MPYTFELALSHVKQGGRISREGWNGRGMHVQLNKGGSGFEGNHTAYLMIYNVNKTFTPWVPSQSDLLADDWTLMAPIVRMADPQSAPQVAPPAVLR